MTRPGFLGPGRLRQTAWKRSADWRVRSACGIAGRSDGVQGFDPAGSGRAIPCEIVCRRRSRETDIVPTPDALQSGQEALAVIASGFGTFQPNWRWHEPSADRGEADETPNRFLGLAAGSRCVPAGTENMDFRLYVQSTQQINFVGKNQRKMVPPRGLEPPHPCE